MKKKTLSLLTDIGSALKFYFYNWTFLINGSCIAFVWYENYKGFDYNAERNSIALVISFFIMAMHFNGQLMDLTRSKTADFRKWLDKYKELCAEQSEIITRIHNENQILLEMLEKFKQANSKLYAENESLHQRLEKGYE
jgi:hypothetical protein